MNGLTNLFFFTVSTALVLVIMCAGVGYIVRGPAGANMVTRYAAGFTIRTCKRTTRSIVLGLRYICVAIFDYILHLLR